jgi:hypothetical protein
MRKALDAFVGFFEYTDIDRMPSKESHEHISKGAVLIDRGGKPGVIHVVVDG